ncbi:MAG TPA: biotin carboxylase N-terminal domain-containing protein [Streptosporangiaceae bacterium]|jgi:acetyl-CoA carboxylase biotin carboxylase subunit|nr:biotin carboxylase N-terminal domain-containing protein [Streptosporangiaceae bacterium]
MVRRLLIANRGEIAVRIIRTCRRLGIETVLAVSAADRDCLPARMADHTVLIGPADPAASYLDVDAVLGAARTTGADAIHPGYGFLAENPRLAAACAAAGIVFVGPTEAQLAAAGDKLAAREHAVAAGLPVLPGGEVRDLRSARRLAGEIGWPVLVKAAGGGGGRGMKKIGEPAELADAIELARAEAGAAFADRRVYLERFLSAGRHIEVQIAGDGERVIHFGERDCSIQRRYQKLVEEAPAPGLGASTRAALHAAAVALGERLRYRGLGTVEFLVAGADFYFLELNARIQVEHPVTEAVYGVDLVAEQLAIAEGRPPRPAPDTTGPDATGPAGHAIECRINAEDWTRGFRPSPGMVTAAVFPAGDGIRVDTHVQAGTRIPPHYDSLLAKLIVHAADRTAALALLRGALARCEIHGVTTNLPMFAELTRRPEFAAGCVDTAWFPAFLERRDSERIRERAGEGAGRG